MNTHNQNLVFSAIPPHMVEEILNNGSKKQIDKARKMLNLSGRIRGQRQSLAELAVKPTAIAGNKDRLVYDAEFSDVLPGKLVRSEGDPATRDNAVDEAYESAGATYDLYNEVFNRNSIDNNGMQIISSVHYMQGYDNAFWDGEQMVYGDGDEYLPEEERLFNRFTKSIDIIAHELTHGVMQFEANLVYFSQPGALNESFSDVFGILVKQRVNNQTAEEANWLIGEEIFTPNISGVALRSMKDPGTAYADPLLGNDPQPAHMDNYVHTFKDNGGVHINSGIPNKAFYATAIEMGGYAWEKAGKIWYIAMCDKLSSSADFQEAANVTYVIAEDLYGKNSPEHLAVAKGWETVGIKVESQKLLGCNLFARKP